MAGAVFLTYPLQMYPIVEIFLPGVQKRFPDKFAVVVELCFRYLLVVITCKYTVYILQANDEIQHSSMKNITYNWLFILFLFALSWIGCCGA